MKQLFISDLDGTLLNENIEISKFTKETLNKLSERGLEFSIATARSAASVGCILEGIVMKYPIVLMNGAMIYNLDTKKYIKVFYLTKEQIWWVAECMHDFDITGFAYSVKNHQLVTYYEEIKTEGQRAFYEERVSRYHKKFTQIPHFSALQNEGVAYFCITGSKNKLEPFVKKIKARNDLNFAYYEDIYSDDLWYLEIFSKDASKFHAVQFLREYTNADYITGFGDNLNDLPLFQASNKKIAVSNAKQELKNAADEIILSNKEDGVARYLLKIFEK